MSINEQIFTDFSNDYRQLEGSKGDLAVAENLRRKWLAKDGLIKQQMKNLRELTAEEKPIFAGRLNQIREQLESALAKIDADAESAKLQKELSNEYFDCTLPGAELGVGGVHPVTLVERRIYEILRPFGFTIVQGPEVEREFYCFDSLNIPKHHPARDMQDTFFLEEPDTSLSTALKEKLGRPVLRTHTTSVQARVLEKGELPVKILSLGRVYRNESEDPSHLAMFHQFELVWLEKGLTLSHLQGLITHILRELYGAKRQVKFVPKIYPYTEPSIGAQIDCSVCEGSGCPACGGAGFVTVGGAGMIHEKVLKEFGYKPEEVNGFAFGLGTSRLAGQIAVLPTLASVYENDLRRYKAI